MCEIISLKEMQPGQRAYVKKLLVSGSIRRRLLDIGLVEGTEIKCVGKSPAGDPSAFYIRGAVIAIRSEDSRNVIAELIEEGNQHGEEDSETKVIALAGNPNSGKTTLFKLIAGIYEPADGGLFVSSSAKLGYVEQHACADFSKTAYEEMLSVFAPLIEMEAR